jgi:uncharacterized protein (UPF0276 family)
MAPELTVSLGCLSEYTQTRTALAAAGFPARIPTLEILWDNYCALDPVQLADDLAVIADRVMLHVMWSRLLEVDDAAFGDYLARLARHVRVLRPLAVSDHLCRFRIGGTFVGSGQEYAYDAFALARDRIARYQDAIGQPLLIENNASLEQPVAKQVAFLHELMEAAGCGILYDISNAVVGELNGCGRAEQWRPLIAGRALRCHIGGYDYDAEVDRQIDSHASDVSRATQDALRELLRAPGIRIESITYERDLNRTVDAVAADLRRIAECLEPPRS